MDAQQFDALIKTMSGGGPRRSVLRAFCAGAIATLAGRLLSAEDAEAKKKRRKQKRCKNGTTTCGKKACCRADQTCVNGACVNQNQLECARDGDCNAGEACANGQCVPGNGACGDAGDCAANESCIAGQCRCVFPSKVCGDLCCASDEACINGQCLIGQGTCAAGDDICAGDDITCNGNAACLCATRLDDGEPRCIQFVSDSRDICTCDGDFRCEQDFGVGTICIKGGLSCPDCLIEELGRCARLCPTQNGN